VPTPGAPASNLIALARAYNAAWNAHDLAVVLGFFTPDAIVRHRNAPVPEDIWNAHDVATVSDYLEGPDGWDKGVSWAQGRAAIGAPLVTAFRQHARVEVSNFRVTDQAVTWDYQLRQDPFQQLPGFAPLEGTATADVEAGQIVRLSLVDDPGSVARQQAAVTAIVGAQLAQREAAATRRRAAAGSPPRTPAEQVPAAAGGALGIAEPAWPLAFAALGATALALAAWRRRGEAQQRRPRR
jgi:hypothetical protein